MTDRENPQYFLVLQLSLYFTLVRVWYGSCFSGIQVHLASNFPSLSFAEQDDTYSTDQSQEEPNVVTSLRMLQIQDIFYSEQLTMSNKAR